MPYFNKQQILNIHIPRWSELPEFDLYMDQVVSYIKYNLDFISISDETSYITSTMINNYVNQGIISPPIHKKYNKHQIARLIFLTVTKQVYSISEIKLLLQYQDTLYPLNTSYDYFCKEFESIVKSLCLSKNIKHIPLSDDKHTGVFMFRMLLVGIASKIYIDNELYIIDELIR